MKSIFLVATVLLAYSVGAKAALIDRGNGMIYDSSQNITWLADANYAQTSGYSEFGAMSWDVSRAWADQLNYGGYDDWRLFNHDSLDTHCSQVGYRGGVGGTAEYYGSNCINNELGHLFYIDLGLSAGDSILDSTDPDLALFSNIQDHIYWSGTGLNHFNAWEFVTVTGVVRNSGKDGMHYAWAVRDGDVTAVPLPATIWLFLPAFGMLVATSNRLHR